MAKSGAILSAGAAATAIGGAYKFGEFLYKAKRLKDVGPSNAVYVRLIKRVRSDLDEVKRLLTVPEVKKALEANPNKAKWVYGAIRDVRGALENITPHTERVASDVDDGRRVGLRHRVYWLLSEKEKLENREKELHASHASLNEVIGFLTALEPVDQSEKGHAREHSHDTRNTKIDVDIRHGGPERRVEERDIYIEKHEHAPRRVEERETWIQRDDREPRRVVEERETWVERGNGPRHVDERHIQYDARGRPQQYDEREFIEHREGRYDDRYYDDRQHGGRIDERELHIERDPRDPRHVEARYSERGPGHFEEKRYEQRGRFEPGLGRRPESFEDRVPERETFMQSDVRRGARSPYGQYAEYGAPQPVGAADYRRRFAGDPGFGDDIVLNPQPVPPMDRGQNEEWIEERENYGYDQYGNKLPQQNLGTRYPQYPPRSRF